MIKAHTLRQTLLAIILSLAAPRAPIASGDAQTESYGARTSTVSVNTGGVGAGGGGLGGISELLGKQNTGAMVNEFTGQPAFGMALGSIAAQNGLSYSVNLSYYGGGLDALASTSPQYAPGSWVGAGFTLKAPFIQVAGEDLVQSRQKYYLSLDGSSQQEMIPLGTGDTFVLKNNPYIRIQRYSFPRASFLKDRCPNQTNQLFSFTVPVIDYWTVNLVDGTSYLFGTQNADCDGAESELCHPIVGNNFKYKPFYTLQQYGKAGMTYFLTRIMDRQGQSAIWFRYQKVQEDVVGSCNSINNAPTAPTSLDRAVYLKEIYSTNGTLIGDYQTSKIVFTTAPKTEEPTIISLAANPSAFYENQKLTGLDFYEKGALTNSLSFGYGSLFGRMVLQTINAKTPSLSNTRNVLILSYASDKLRLDGIQDALGRRVQYEYGTVEAGKVNGTNGSQNYQELEFSAGAGFPQADTRIAMARQVGNKFYVETENWGTGCTSGAALKEHMFEYENNGTYWSLKRVIDAPVAACPTAMDVYLSPDGKYFVWAYSSGPNTTKIAVYDLTTGVPSPSPVTFDYTTTNSNSQLTDIYAYPDWFAAFNTSYAKNLTFFTKDASGNWTNATPAAIAPSTYSAPATLSPRSNNYSGENEGISSTGTGLTFANNIVAYPGPTCLVVTNTTTDVFHVFANDGGIKDYVKGLETTTPALTPFTSADVGDGDLSPLPRPWFRQTTGSQAYHNNTVDKDVSRVVVSDNLILMEYATGKDYWKYLYVLGWDGNQLRYLYDYPLYIDQDAGEGTDEFDFAAGPDYFLLKNQYAGAGTRKGIFYYKVDLKNWKVIPPSTSLPISDFNTVGEEDWVLKPYPDYFFLERMENGKGSTAFTPALVTQGENSGSIDMGGIWNKTLCSMRVFQLNANRTPVDISAEFTRNSSPVIRQSNFSAQGDRILSVDTYANPITSTGYKFVTSAYNCWKRNADPAGTPNYIRYPIPNLTNQTDIYQSSRLVQGGMITTLFKKTYSEETFQKIYFVPDVFQQVPSASQPGTNVQGSSVVTKVSVWTGGYYSVGNNIQDVVFSFPTTSPEGGPTYQILKNYQSGVPNFKYVRKDFPEGAQVASHFRDELDYKVAPEKNALIGSHLRSWTLPDKASFKKPGGAWDSSLATTATVSGAPSNSYAIRNLRDSSRAYFHSAYRGSVSYSTYYDAKNGSPKITVSKAGGKYRLSYDLYQQDLVGSYAGPYTLLRQRSVFQFSSDPCAHAAGVEDPCGNLDAAWFTSTRLPSIVSSSIMTYDGLNRLKDVYEWRPDALGSVYPPMNGDPASTGTGWKWVKVHSNTKWQDQSVARCKSDMVTESEDLGVYSSTFIGGPDCNVLGTVANSTQGTAALLTGEEDILTQNCAGGIPCYGAFGTWEAGSTTLQSQVAHSGINAIKVTALYGPTINVKLRETAGFMDRKKGYVVSAWVYASANSDPAFRIEFRASATTAPNKNIDLVQEYITSKGAFPVGKWVKLERQISYEELISTGLFTSISSSNLLRIWIGKGATTTTNPVYVDDVRLYPADASFSTRNYDATGLVTSALDSENEPVTYEYDIWRNVVGTRNKNGMVSASSAVKLINE